MAENRQYDHEYKVILSILVDTFFSKISLIILQVPKLHNTACVLAWGKTAIGGAYPPVVPVTNKVAPY